MCACMWLVSIVVVGLACMALLSDHEYAPQFACIGYRASNHNTPDFQRWQCRGGYPTYVVLVQVKELKPDNFTPSIIKQTDDYLYAEYQSPTFGFVDDVEFYVDEAKKQVL